ncbi:MAG: hemerythrin domain-containing protein [Bdellovibrionales bacterium]
MKTKKKSKGKSQRTAKSSGQEITDYIMKDHKEIRECLKIMKDSEADIGDREDAFFRFIPLFVAHAKPEECVLYSHLKSFEDLRTLGFEGETEHDLAERMLAAAERSRDDDVWCARIKVLAELVEHHIEEEEKTILPAFKKKTDADERKQLGEQFLDAKAEFSPEQRGKAPRSREDQLYAH